MPEGRLLHDVPVEGGELRVAEWPGEEPAVLLLHGLSGTHVTWHFLADALAGRRLLAPDLRGRGESRELPGPYGLVAHADDAATVARRLTAGPVTVVGHSMGGFIAVVLAQRHPGLVAGLVLVDGGLPFAAEELAHTEEVVAGIRAGLEEAYRDLASYQDAFRRHPAFVEDWSPYVEDYLAYDLVGEPPGMHRSADVDAVVADQTDITSYDLATAIDGLTGAEFLHSDRGFLDDPPGLYAAATVEELAARFPQVRPTRVPGVNHYTIVMSARGAAAVADAVRRLPGASH